MPKFVEHVEISFEEWYEIEGKLRKLERLEELVADYESMARAYIAGPSPSESLIKEILGGRITVNV